MFNNDLKLHKTFSGLRINESIKLNRSKNIVL